MFMADIMYTSGDSYLACSNAHLKYCRTPCKQSPPGPRPEYSQHSPGQTSDMPPRAAQRTMGLLNLHSQLQLMLHVREELREKPENWSRRRL